MIYKPIDYNTWNFDGQGSNIIHLLSHIEKEIWNITLPFQDKRDDTGHAENVTYFALKLLEYLPGKREIVIPEAILHDIGWSQLTQEELDQFYLPNWQDFEPELRKRHQEEGVKLANQLLEKVGYSKKYIPQILEIISQHDTRKGFFSQEDGLARDADKLWQFTLPHWKIFVEKREIKPEVAHLEVTQRISKPEFFYSDIAKQIAKIELKNTLDFYNKKKSNN